MNATDGLAVNHTPSLFTADKIGGFGYAIAISVGLLLLITTITLASYFCTRRDGPPDRQARHGPAADEVADVEAGLDEATLMTYPKVRYAEAKAREKGTTASCCSICLADYSDSDVLRLLPDCGHLFHVRCVDPWLRRHPTCPVCRTSPLPSPLPTPLAEVVPLRGIHHERSILVGALVGL